MSGNLPRTALYLAVYPILAAAVVLTTYLAQPEYISAQAPTQMREQLDHNCRLNLQCRCQSRELMRRTPRATLEAIMAQPPSPARLTALDTALLDTAVRDHVAILRACGPVLHPEGAPGT